MVGGGGDEPGGPDRLEPIGTADLLDGLAVWQESEIPGRTKAGEEIHPVCQGCKLVGNARIRIEGAVNPGEHGGTPL